MRSSYLVLIYGMKYPDKRLSLTTFNTKNAQKALIADNWPFAEYGHIRVFLAPLQQGVLPFKRILQRAHYIFLIIYLFIYNT